MNLIGYKTVLACSFPPLLRRCPLVVLAPRREQLLAETKNYSAQTAHFSSDML